MTMTYTTLANYGKALLDVIRGAESLHAFPVDVRDGTITLGYGYTFIRKIDKQHWARSKFLAEDLAKIGVTLTSDDIRRLDAISKSASDGVTVLEGLVGTKELVAISSMFYNGPGLVRKELIDALANGNRAEAWYQV